VPDDPTRPGPVATDRPPEHPVARDQHAELSAEQRYLDVAYGRLDEMRQAALRVAEGYRDVRQGGTHQARLERDAATAHTRRRLAALDIGDNPLCFGRLDLRADRNGAATAADADTAGPYYIGRLSVTDEDQNPLVVDWRAPVAEPFYRATPVEPMGVARRRHFHSRGRELLGIDDEVFDAAATAEAGYTVVGEAALLAALGRERTGRMHDIVATIQAEQDEAIRADLPGVLIVAGGPGTGKTAVALHRAAYLLYTHRRRLAARGVLLVGPNTIFLHYIDQVLPSLGEDEVQLTTPAGLKPQITISGTDDDRVAAVKGDARMAKVVARALSDRERPLPREVVVTLDGHRLRLRTRDSARIVERAKRRRGTHNERRPSVMRMVLDHLRDQYRRSVVRAYRRDANRVDPAADPALFGADSVDDVLVDVPVAAALARGERAPQEWEAEITSRIRRLPEVRAALERMWPVLSGPELVHDLFSFEALIRSAADGILDRDEQRGLFRPRSASVREVAWTEADAALVDEADALLGPVEAARPRRSRRRRRSTEETEQLAGATRMVDDLGLGGYLTAADVARRYAGEPAALDDDGAGDVRTFGHVLVDEAQDLTAMQWRMLGRRCPSGSMTLVGDAGQASRPGALGDWDAVVPNLPSHQPARRVTLSVNYRTPAEIMAVANRVLAAAAASVEPVQSVRSVGRRPRFERVGEHELVGSAASEARRARTEGGTVVVIAPLDVHGALVDELADVEAVADSAAALDAPVAVLMPVEAKGLEFDHVVLVEPAQLVTPDPAGLRLLYVTLSRATQSLTVVHAAALPEALQPVPDHDADHEEGSPSR
jgi:DNA helicase IV